VTPTNEINGLAFAALQAWAYCEAPGPSPLWIADAKPKDSPSTSACSRAKFIPGLAPLRAARLRQVLRLEWGEDHRRPWHAASMAGFRKARSMLRLSRAITGGGVQGRGGHAPNPGEQSAPN